MSGIPEGAALRSRVAACAAALCAGALVLAGALPSPPGDASAVVIAAGGESRDAADGQQVLESQILDQQAFGQRPSGGAVSAEAGSPSAGAPAVDQQAAPDSGNAQQGTDAWNAETPNAAGSASEGSNAALNAASSEVPAEASTAEAAGAAALGSGSGGGAGSGSARAGAGTAAVDLGGAIPPVSGKQQTLFVKGQIEDALPALLDLSVVETATSDPDDALPVVRYPFARPVALTDGFGYRTAPVAQFHDAQDFAAAMGTEILAIADGKVIEAGQANDGCGFGLRVLHEIAGKDVTSRYCHMMNDSHDFKVGDTVEIGDPVGRVGATGMAFGAHLHLAIRVNNRPVDPMSFLKKYGRMTRGESEAANAKRTDEPGSHVEDVVPPSEDPRNQPVPPTTVPPTTQPPTTQPPTTQPPTTKPPTTPPPTTPPPTTPPPTTPPPTTPPPTTPPPTTQPPTTPVPTTPPTSPTAPPSSDG